MTNRCSSCRYFEEVNMQQEHMFVHKDEGFCKRLPPAYASGYSGALSNDFVNPIVFKSDWCGEHKRHPTKKTKKNPQLNVRAVIAFYCEEFKLAFDVMPSITGKDSGAAINMLKEHTIAEVNQTITEFFKDTPIWNKENNMYGLNNIASAWNKMTVKRKISTDSADDITYEAMLNEQAVKFGGHPRWDEYHGMILDTHELMTFEEFLKEYGEE